LHSLSKNIGFAETGQLEVRGLVLSYSYDLLANNINAHTIQGLSLKAEENFRNNVDFKKFVDYYGRSDYGDHYITAAFEGSTTAFDNGNADFGEYESFGRTGKFLLFSNQYVQLFIDVMTILKKVQSHVSECIKKGTVYFNFWMQAVGEMETALVLCQIDGYSVGTWDRAVAYYVGSLEDAGGEKPGNLLYTLANKRCENFKTCGANGDETVGTAKANVQVMDLFAVGQRNLQDGKCAEARANKERIIQLMTVPFVQGTMRYVYINDFQLDAGEKVEAEGAVFAAALLPHVYACDQDDAATIYKNSKVGANGDISFAGGLYDDEIGDYLAGSQPCRTSRSSTMGFSIAASVIVAAVGGLGLIL
jgi:hypothetical protein